MNKKNKKEVKIDRYSYLMKVIDKQAREIYKCPFDNKKSKPNEK